MLRSRSESIQSPLGRPWAPWGTCATVGAQMLGSINCAKRSRVEPSLRWVFLSFVMIVHACWPPWCGTATLPATHMRMHVHQRGCGVQHGCSGERRSVARFLRVYTCTAEAAGGTPCWCSQECTENGHQAGDKWSRTTTAASARAPIKTLNTSTTCRVLVRGTLYTCPAPPPEVPRVVACHAWGCACRAIAPRAAQLHRASSCTVH